MFWPIIRLGGPRNFMNVFSKDVHELGNKTSLK